MLRNLMAEMVRRDVSRVRLAEALGLTRRSIDNKVTGHTRFKTAEKKVVCEMLGMDFEADAESLFQDI